MPSLRLTAALAATAALALPAAAEASERHDHNRSHVIAGKVAKPLAPKSAKRLQDRIARGDAKLPMGPRLADTPGVAKLRAPKPITTARRGSNPLPAPSAKLFGTHGTFATKRQPIIDWVNYTFARVFHDMGGSFAAPHVEAVNDGGTTSTGCGRVNNGMYCPATHTVGYAWQYSQNVFNTIGDAGFAGLMAHEFGHAAQRNLNLYGGWMSRVVYQEAFADCMAGGWLVQMYNWGYYDNIGRGDWREWLDALTQLSDATTTYDNHGTPAWRHANASYGWNTGMRGCIAWFSSIAR